MSKKRELKEYKINTQYIVKGEHIVKAENAREAAEIFKKERNRAWFNFKEEPTFLKEKTFEVPAYKDYETIFTEDEEFDSLGMKRPCKGLQDEFEDSVEENINPKRIGNLVFVWGIKSWDDLTESDANLYTMNDIDVLFDLETNKYSLSIEEIYQFDNREAKIEYLEKLCLKLKEFVLEVGYTEEELNNFYDCSAVTMYYPTHIIGAIIPLEAYTLKDLWQKFKLFVVSYKSISSLID